MNLKFLASLIAVVLVGFIFTNTVFSAALSVTGRDCPGALSDSDFAGFGIGDADADGVISYSDFVFIMEYITDGGPLVQQSHSSCGYQGNYCFCDISGNDKVDAYDAALLHVYLSSMFSGFNESLEGASVYSDLEGQGIGDADADNSITTKDALYILSYLMGNEENCGYNNNELFCDISGDDRVDSYDAAVLLSLIASQPNFSLDPNDFEEDSINVDPGIGVDPNNNEIENLILNPIVVLSVDHKNNIFEISEHQNVGLRYTYSLSPSFFEEDYLVRDMLVFYKPSVLVSSSETNSQEIGRLLIRSQEYNSSPFVSGNNVFMNELSFSEFIDEFIEKGGMLNYGDIYSFRIESVVFNSSDSESVFSNLGVFKTSTSALDFRLLKAETPVIPDFENLLISINGKYISKDTAIDFSTPLTVEVTYSGKNRLPMALFLQTEDGVDRYAFYPFLESANCNSVTCNFGYKAIVNVPVSSSDCRLSLKIGKTDNISTFRYPIILDKPIDYKFKFDQDIVKLFYESGSNGNSIVVPIAAPINNNTQENIGVEDDSGLGTNNSSDEITGMPMIYVSDIGKVLVAGYGSSSSIGTISTSGSDPLANSSGNTFGGQQDKAYYLIVGTENVLLKDFQTQLDKYNTLNNKDVSLEDISLKINVIESPSSSEGFSNILKADYSFKVQRISTFLGIKIGSSNENVIIPATYE